MYIIGAGGFALEIFDWFCTCKAFNDQYHFKGFIDKDCSKSRILDRIGKSDFELYDQNNFIFDHKARYVIAIGDPKIKKKVFYELSLDRVNYLTFIHSSSVIGQNVVLEEGVIIGPFCVIESNTVIKNMSSINSFSFIGHDSCIGEFCTISPRSTILGGVRISNSVFVGASSTINVGCYINTNCFIGMDSSVTKDITDSCLKVYGVPAKEIAK